ncbi:hypothetical protein [Nocardioides euryhalodurans]|uniref:Uncharacterized protein n=1 Tax=Nocardioides euryhalodurans TaxID=2518370 RepID=A0A4P7GJZ3_9ACTN|nr:hypothetical protein [Nocardioides euryhalodurans]QBR92326.1 hypothetical protein EXE57_08535 [Nocardioides euryhalodurans]
MELPRFEDAGSTRPVQIARPGRLEHALAPYVAVDAVGHRHVTLALVSGEDRLAVAYDDDGFSLAVTNGGLTTDHRSRRAGRPDATVERVALTLTGTHLTVWSREGGEWLVRGRVELRGRIDTHDEEWLAALRAEGGQLRGYGQVGLRDLRLVTYADGSPVRESDRVLVTATSAGPGFFDTAHTSVWTLDPAKLSLVHRSDLFFRRPGDGGVYGDHASHLVRDGGRWLLATSTWGDFDPQRPGATVAVTLAETDADLLTGRHVLDTRALDLPTTGLRSVGVWDPHLVRSDDEWLVAYVSATRFFRFHPVLAAGPSLETLELRSAAVRGHRETEGSTLHRFGDDWRVLVSDGHRRRYPVMDLDLTEVGEIDAPYTSNIPWPTLVEHDGGLLMVGFDGEPAGGRLVPYGSHGAVRFART